MNDTEQIKDRLPIEQVVGTYVPLKRSGRILKARCPFHAEKTPSFTVSPERGIFKCFGCGEGGDIFDFVMKIEGLTFPETIKLLAERAGVELSETTPHHNEGGVGRDRLLQLNDYASRLWHAILEKHPKAEIAREYLKKRGVSDATIKKFQLGYAPFGSATRVALKKANFTDLEIAAAGDPSKFQDRIIFPISDITGRVIAFTGRLLQGADDPAGSKNLGPKYWNTPETPLFIKSRTLYALHHAKRAIQDEDLAIIAEGQMDTVMLHQAGFTHTVASSGTALTIEQVNLIARFTSNVAFAYDGDKAGIEATKRGLSLALEAELNPTVIAIPKGSDPADLVKNNPDAFAKAYAERIPFLEWLFQQARPDDSPLTPQSKKEIAKELIPWVARIQDPLEQNEWLRIVAAHLQTEESSLKAALTKISTPPATPRIVSPLIPAAQAHSPLEQKAILALALIITFPDTLPSVRAHLINIRLISLQPPWSQVLDEVEKVPANTHVADWLAEQLGAEPFKQILLQVEEQLGPYREVEMTTVQALQEIMLILQRLRSDSKEEAKAKLAKRISDAQVLGDSQQLKELFHELKNLL